MGLFDFLDEEKNKKKEKEELERKMDGYGLSDREKEEVRKGNYDPWDFEEDDASDEDDYYHEDI